MFIIGFFFEERVKRGYPERVIFTQYTDGGRQIIKFPEEGHHPACKPP